MVLSKHVKSSINDRIAHKLLFKTKGPYIILEKATPSSYWLQRLTFCEGLVMPGRKVKEPSASMENIPPTMVIHKHVDEEDTRCS